VQSFIVSYVGYRFITNTIKLCSVVFAVTLRLLVMIISSHIVANVLYCYCHGGSWQDSSKLVIYTGWAKLNGASLHFCL